MKRINYETYIKKHFKYDNGTLIRDDRKNSNGSLDKDGYLIIKVKGKQFKAHRIVWFLHYGKFPLYEIDHINRNKLDNRIENLRDVPHLINLKNVKPVINKVTKCQYVYYDTCTKGLKAKYRVKVPNKHSASFRTLSEAKEFLNKEGVQYECL